MLYINQCLTLMCRSLSLLHSWCEVLHTSMSLCVQYVRLSTGYLVPWAGVHQWRVPCISGPLSALILWAPHQPITDQTFHLYLDTMGASNMWAHVRILWLLILVAHSQRIHRLCAEFSINSLSFPQLHTLVFQTENAHKQILQIRFAFLLFLPKSAWSLAPFVYCLTQILFILPSAGGVCLRRQNEWFCSHLHLCKSRVASLSQCNCLDEN